MVSLPHSMLLLEFFHVEVEPLKPSIPPGKAFCLDSQKIDGRLIVLIEPLLGLFHLNNTTKSGQEARKYCHGGQPAAHMGPRSTTAGDQARR